MERWSANSPPPSKSYRRRSASWLRKFDARHPWNTARPGLRPGRRLRPAHDGAGIVGSRVALEAAQAGLKVALLDAADFGSATSQSSSKLIHGGLRYLPMGDLRLVRENHLERHALLDRVAPHLVWPLDFVVPVYTGLWRAVEVWGGLVVYSALSGFRQSRAGLVGGERARSLVPELKLEGLSACGFMEDAQTNDSRLVMATVTAAARLGVSVHNYSRLTNCLARDLRRIAGTRRQHGVKVEARGVRRLSDRRPEAPRPARG